eukprot:gene11044-biopygen15381
MAEQFVEGWPNGMPPLGSCKQAHWKADWWHQSAFESGWLDLIEADWNADCSTAKWLFPLRCGSGQSHGAAGAGRARQLLLAAGAAGDAGNAHAPADTAEDASRIRACFFKCYRGGHVPEATTAVSLSLRAQPQWGQSTQRLGSLTKRTASCMSGQSLRWSAKVPGVRSIYVKVNWLEFAHFAPDSLLDHCRQSSPSDRGSSGSSSIGLEDDRRKEHANTHNIEETP